MKTTSPTKAGSNLVKVLVNILPHSHNLEQGYDVGRARIRTDKSNEAQTIVKDLQIITCTARKLKRCSVRGEKLVDQKKLDQLLDLGSELLYDLNSRFLWQCVVSLTVSRGRLGTRSSVAAFSIIIGIAACLIASEERADELRGLTLNGSNNACINAVEEDPILPKLKELLGPYAEEFSSWFLNLLRPENSGKTTPFVRFLDPVIDAALLSDNDKPSCLKPSYIRDLRSEQGEGPKSLTTMKSRCGTRLREMITRMKKA